MKIHELIAILENHPNQDADVIIVANLGDIDDEADDVQCYSIEVHNQDEFFNDFVEIFATDKELK